MKNTFKRVLSFILALTMVLGLGVNALALNRGKIYFHIALNGALVSGEAGDALMGGQKEDGTYFEDVLVGSSVLKNINNNPRFQGNNLIDTLVKAGLTDYKMLTDGYHWDEVYYKDANFSTPYTPKDLVSGGDDSHVYLNYVDSCEVYFYMTKKPGNPIDFVTLTQKDETKDYFVIGDELIETFESPMDGYEYKWADADGKIYEKGVKVPAETITLNLYPELVAMTTYTVTFDPKGGNFVDEEETGSREVYAGTAIGALPEVEKEGNKFLGWKAATETGYWDAKVIVNKNYDLEANWETINYWTVTFDVNGGDPLPEEQRVKKVERGTAIGEMPTPTRAGYAFGGWYVGVVRIDVTTEITANRTLTARWVAGDYTVTFDNCFEVTGRAPVSVGITNGARIATNFFSSHVAEPEGYKFDGWYTDAGYTTLATIPTGTWNLTGDVTFYAKYTPKTYEVEVYLNVYGDPAAEYVGKVEFTYGTPYLPDLDVEIPTTYKDHPFLAWYVVGLEGGDKKFSELVELRDEIWKLDAKNIKIYAVYSSDVTEYSITYKYPALDEENLGSETTLYYVAGREIGNVPEIREEYQKTGYTVKWVYEGTNTPVQATDGIDKNRVAVLEYTAKVCTAVFKSNGIQVWSKNVTYGQRIAMILPSLGDIRNVTDADMPGYNFLGWELEGKTYEVGCADTWTFDENGVAKTFNAVWEPATYTVTLDANGGRFADGTATKQFQIKTGESFSGKLETPAKDNGNAFVIWRIYSTTASYTDFTATDLENKVFEYAQNVTFKAYYKDDVDPSTIDIQMIDTWTGAVIYDSKYDRDCYNDGTYAGVGRWNTTFNYWFTEINDQNRLNYARRDVRTDAIKSYNVYMNGNGEGITGRKAEAAKYGYTAGIATAPDGKVLTPAEMRQTITEDTIFYIVYNTTVGYGAILPDESEVIIATYPARYGQKLGDAVPAIAIGDDLSYYTGGVLPTTNAGLAFNGWYELPDGTNYVGVAVNTPEMQAEVVLKAKHFSGTESSTNYKDYDDVAAIYVAYTNTKDIDAKLDAKGGKFENGLGEIVVKIPYGENVFPYINANIPTRVGYNFKNWTLDGTNIWYSTGKLMPNKAVTFEAVWEQKTIQLTYLNPTGSVAKTGTVHYDDTITNLPVLSADRIPVGQKFVDWVYVDANGNETAIKANDKWAIDATTATITPKFEYINYTITFDANGGTFADGASKKVFTAHYGDNVLGLYEGTPVKEGYNFGGWCLASGAAVPANATVSMTDTVYAYWIEKTVKINFYDPMAVKPNVAIGVVYVNYGKTFMEAFNYVTWAPGADTANHTGYTFDVWVDEAGNEYENDTPILEDDEILNLTARYTANKYTLTFDPNGGEIPNNADKTKTVTYGEPFGTLLDETQVKRTGYTLTGWKDGFGNDIKATTPYNYTVDGTIYAQWKANTYTITFKDGETTVGTKKVTYDTAFGTLPAPEKTGYTFNGWWVNGVNNVETLIVSDNWLSVNNNYRAEDQNAYAKWIGNGYVIKFNANGGSYTGNNLPVQYGKDYKLPTENISREGYDFLYWTSDEAGTTRVYDGVYNVLGNSTYYAKWQVKQYKVTFDPNNAAATIEKGVRNFDYGYKITQADLFTIPGTYAGYKHTGRWFVEEDGGTKVFLPDFNYGITKDITIKAEWEPAEFTITYSTSLEGTTAPAPIKVKYLDVIKEDQLPELTKPGYEFLGWQYAGDGAELVANGENKWQMTSDITIHAMWNQPTYTLTFDYNNGTAPVTGTYYYGEAIEFPADPTKTGYTFNGWKFGTTMIEKTGAWFSYLANTTFVADWTQINYSITYAFNDGVTPNQTVEGYHYGEPIVLITEPTWIGHTFNCWKCNGKIMHAGDIFEFTDNVEFVADWTTDTYTLTFKYNNGDEVKGTAATADLEQTYVYGQNIALPDEPSKTGYTFDGWYIGENKLTGASQYKYTGNKQAIAKWIAKEYDVTFNLNDDEGTVSGPWKYTYGEQIVFPSDPTKTGYTFDAWFKGTQRLTSSAKLDVTESIVIDAKYNKKVYTVVIDSNAPAGEAYITGDKQVVSFTIEYLGKLETTDLPNNLYRKGYHFTGWYLNKNGTGDRITAADVWSITDHGDTVYLYAGWEAEKYNINFVLNSADTTKEAEWLNKEYNNETLKTQIGADKFANKTVTYGQNIELPAAAVMNLKGYTFAGWYWNENGATDIKPVPNGKWLFDAGEPNAEVYIFAKWNAKMYTINYDYESDLPYAKGVFGEKPTSFNIYFDTLLTEEDLISPVQLHGYIDSEYWCRDLNNDAETKLAVNDRWVWTDEEFPTIFAHWTPKTYTLQFVVDTDEQFGLNEGYTSGTFDTLMPEPMSQTFDAAYTLPTITGNSTGYDFMGWKIYAYGKYSDILPTSGNYWLYDGEANGATYTLTPVWQAHQWTITFSVADGDGIEAYKKDARIAAISGLTDTNKTVTPAFDTKITAEQLPVLTLKGYEFLGWFNGDDEIEVGEYWKFDANTTLKAKWQAETYTDGIGAFDAVGSLKGADGKAGTEDDLYYKPEKLVFTTTAPVTVTYDTDIAEDKFPEDPTLEGYTFEGWLYDDNGTEKNIGTKANHVPFEADLTDADPITLKAKWTPNTYTVTINPGEGATVAPTTATVTYGENVDLPTPTKTGYTFDGWYYYNEGEKNPCVPVLNGIWTEPTTNVHAHWTAKGFTVYFNPGTYGSVSPKSKTVVYDQPYGWLPTPEYGSYTFLGWVNQNNVLVDSTTSYKINGDSTLYASFRGSSRIILDYRNMAGLELSMDDVEEVFLGEVPETVETLVPEVVEEAKEEAAEEAVEEVAEEVTEEAAEEVVETPVEEVVEETTEVVLENRNSANAVVIDGGDEVAVKEALEEALETEEVVVIKDGEDTKAVKVIGYNAEKDNFEIEEVTEINPDTGASVPANIAPAMFALLAAAAFAFGKRK